MMEGKGHCDAKFAELRPLLARFIQSGEELGASIAVNIAGKDVVDIWDGYADDLKTIPWGKDTIVTVFSTTKTVTSLAALILIDRGIIDPYAKVSQYWPEFGVNGKEAVEVRHILSHTSGVSGWEETMKMEHVCDVRSANQKLAQQHPWWTPGIASGYHSLTMGHLVSELVYRCTGKSLKHFIAEEIAGPLGADFQLGASERDWPRISNMSPFSVEVKSRNAKASSVRAKTVMNPTREPNEGNSILWKMSELGAANGYTNARGMVRTLSAVSLGGRANGIQFLSQITIDLIFKEQARGVDLVIGSPVRFGIGFGLTGDGDTFVDEYLPSGRVCYWGGWGGSMVVMDLDRQLTFAYVMNKMDDVGVGSNRAKTYIMAVYKALGVTLGASV
jgi:CubicO group peptidase (beta-lactamase class C family)